MIALIRVLLALLAAPFTCCEGSVRMTSPAVTSVGRRVHAWCPWIDCGRLRWDGARAETWTALIRGGLLRPAAGEETVLKCDRGIELVRGVEAT